MLRNVYIVSENREGEKCNLLLLTIDLSVLKCVFGAEIYNNTG